jgi:dinuclear metal center YbgI/SA1388 family protein
MALLHSIISYLDTYLDIHAVPDGCWNGLQFEGASSVKEILFAVDAGAATFEKAVEEHADMVVVHHGLFWTSANPSYTAVIKKRIDILYKHNISLYACHLPLDIHKTVGNNAGILSLIGAAIESGFAMHEGKPVGYTGLFKKPVTLGVITGKLNASLAAACTVLPFGPAGIRNVGVVSGGCSRAHLDEAVSRGLDLFITGEQIEVYHTAKDAGISVIFAGHHASETVGVKLLAEHVQKKLKVKTMFVDIPTGL